MKPSSLLAKADALKTPLRRRLLAWYRREARDLPWRRTSDPYRIWLSEIMLQQTRVESARAYYERFLRVFPTMQALATAPLDRVLKLWEGLGYYGRARRLHEAARLVTHRFDGSLPTSEATLRQLPGVGRYTAAAIASIAFGEAVAVVDGNVKRVLARLLCIEAEIDDCSLQETLWSLAAILLAPRTAGDYNQAMMELGARLCLPRRPRCHDCPLARLCEGLARGRATSLPAKKPKKDRPHKVFVAAALQRKGRYLLARRPPEGLLGGLFELPGGEVPLGLKPEKALATALAERTHLTVSVGKELTTVRHAYSHFSVEVHVFRCHGGSGHGKPQGYDRLVWVFPSRIDRYALTGVTNKVLPALGIRQAQRVNTSR